ncbi:Hypothetical protein PBC10988_41170 [Planctomycetales bacterium 10988]|nr:Hypothetical protein PBC10988_41170 [Planctomycetales bacterium 10988]
MFKSHRYGDLRQWVLSGGLLLSCAAGLFAQQQPGTRVNPPQYQTNPGQAPPQQQNQPAFSVPALTPGEAAELDRILGAWEAQSSQIQNVSCVFTVWEDVPAYNKKIERTGRMLYESPDRGAYEVQFEKVSNPETGKDEWQSKKTLDHWACDGEAVYRVLHHEETVMVHPLPENLKGESIRNGPLPFLFVAKARDLKQRYFLRPIRPEERAKGQVWLEVYPRYQQDAANFSRAEVILTEGQWLILGLKMYPPGGNTTITHVFTEYKINENGGFIDSLKKAWGGNPYAPHPRGYSKKVQPPAEAAMAERPEEEKAAPKPTMPFNLFRKR